MPRPRSSDFSQFQPLALLAVIVLILYFARELLIPLAFALTLAFLLAPAVSRLEAVGAPRIVSVALSGMLALGAVLGIGYVVTHQLMSVADHLPAYRLDIQNRLATVHSPAEQSFEKAFNAIEGIGEDLVPANRTQARPSSILLQLPPNEVQPVRVIDPSRSQLQENLDLLFRILRPVGTFGIIIVFTVYLLMKREDLRHRILLLAGIGRISVMTEALQDAATRISQYLVLQLAVNASYGILFGAGLYLIGIPDATLWGALAGILRIIPYVGAATSLLFPLVISIAVLHSWWYPVLILGLFLLLELSTANFVEPWLYGTRTGISSLALLIMAIFWTLLWGWPGLILSTPLTVCFVVLGQYVPQMSFLHTVLGTEAELSPEAHFYERLLAMDQREARAIANKFLAGKPLVELYDCIFIPALRLVEQDRHQGTLDEARSGFFFLSVGELIAELTDYHQAQPLALAAESASPGSPNSTHVSNAAEFTASLTRPATLAESCGNRISGILAHVFHRHSRRPGSPSFPHEHSTEPLSEHPREDRPEHPTDHPNESPAGYPAEPRNAHPHGHPADHPAEARNAHPHASATPPAAAPAPRIASPAHPNSAPYPNSAPENDFAVICISASDQADELASHMLAQLMERDGHPTLLLSAQSVSREVLDGLAKEPNTVIFISALPPFAFSQARATCQRVRTHLPHNRIVIGFWENPEDTIPGATQPTAQNPDPASNTLPEHMVERFGSGRPTLVVNTLTQALHQIHQWQHQPTPSKRPHPAPPATFVHEESTVTAAPAPAPPAPAAPVTAASRN